MNLFRSALHRASVKMSLNNLRRARKVAIRGVGTTDRSRITVSMPETTDGAGPGSVKDWADALHIQAPKQITSFIKRKLKY